MDRKTFIKTTGVGVGVSLIPGVMPGNDGLGKQQLEAFSERDLWVLGHRITLYKDATGNLDLALGVTPPHVPGPPPHYHETYDELFLVLEGEMEFVVGKKVIKAKPGSMVDVPKNTVHTFSNAGSEPCKWFNVHTPKGFSGFFETFGIKASENEAIQKSVDKEVIGSVIQRAAEFDMIISK